MSEIKCIGYVTDSAVYTLYDDDGSSFDYKDGEGYSTVIKVTKNDQGYDVNVDTDHPDIKTLVLKLYDDTGTYTEKIIQI